MSATVRKRLKRHTTRVALWFLLIFIVWAALGAFVLNKPSLNLLWLVSWLVIFVLWVRAARFPCPQCGRDITYRYPSNSHAQCQHCGLGLDQPYPNIRDSSGSSG